MVELEKWGKERPENFYQVDKIKVVARIKFEIKFRSFSVEIVLRCSRLPLKSSSVEVVFLLNRLPLKLSSIEVVFC